MSGLLELEPDRERHAKYVDFIDIYASLTDNERRRYRQQYPEESRTMAGIVQRAREEGMQQGIEQGMNRGRVEGERALLRRQLRRRFGDLSPETVERVDQASARDLGSWAENVLDAGTLDEVFRLEPLASLRRRSTRGRCWPMSDRTLTRCVADDLP